MPADSRFNASGAAEAAPAREAPSAPQDLPVPESQHSRKRRIRLILILAAFLVVMLTAIKARRTHPQPKDSVAAPGSRTAVVEQKDFVSSLRLHGIVEAVES